VHTKIATHTSLHSPYTVVPLCERDPTVCCQARVYLSAYLAYQHL